MDGNTVSPYGTWKSPITSDLIVSGAVKLGQVAVDGKDVYWLEGRPAEGGRNVIVRQTPDGRTIDVTPPPFNARTKVHEYGGGDFLVDRGIVYFSNFADQRLYRQEQGSEPRPITPEGKLYYCDGVFDTWRDRLICVREDHEAGDGEPENTLVSIDPAGDQDARILASGSDFYSTPRLSPDGSRLAWLSWNHPNMPWDGTELMVAEVQADGTLGTAVLVAGGPDESIFQPEWSPDGTLYFISDRNSWWNLYRWSDGTVESVLELDAEIGVPQWVFGLSTFAFESSDKI
ncbi:MAG: S9 family peptidase, partial [Dehalococcoidia bacterium]|nr:S9 family peptidase [Dehalococcoidia bacterium]